MDSKHPLNPSLQDARGTYYLTDVTHGMAKLALPAKASLDTPKQIALGRQTIADNSSVACLTSVLKTIAYAGH